MRIKYQIKNQISKIRYPLYYLEDQTNLDLLFLPFRLWKYKFENIDIHSLLVIDVCHFPANDKFSVTFLWNSCRHSFKINQHSYIAYKMV